MFLTLLISFTIQPKIITIRSPYQGHNNHGCLTQRIIIPTIAINLVVNQLFLLEERQDEEKAGREKRKREAQHLELGKKRTRAEGQCTLCLPVSFRWDGNVGPLVLSGKGPLDSNRDSLDSKIATPLCGDIK